MRKYVCHIFLIWMILIPSLVFADESDGPCTGPEALLSLVNRPTFSVSPCTVPFKHLMLETGYQYARLKPFGYEYNFPSAELRLGLPYNFEIFSSLPNYIHHSFEPHTGHSVTSVGAKYQTGHNDKWIGALFLSFRLPTGDFAFGNQYLGAVFNAVASYTINSTLNLLIMVGGSSTTLSRAEGGLRYNSFNPDVVLSWTPFKKLVLYVEVYGQTKTAPDEGSGFVYDTGLIYLLSKNITVDVEYSHYIYGDLFGYRHYVGAGISFLI